MVGRYKVIGVGQDPDEFFDLLLTQLRARENVPINAQEVGNELADRRGNPERMFELKPEEINLWAKIVNGRDLKTGSWIQVLYKGDAEVIVID